MQKRLLVIGLIFILLFTLTGCFKSDSKSSSSSSSSGSVSESKISEYEQLASNIVKNLYGENDYFKLVSFSETLKDISTDRVYKNTFDISVPYILDLYYNDGIIKEGFSIADVVSKETDNGVSVYVMFSYGVELPSSIDGSDEHFFEVKQVLKFEFNFEGTITAVTNII